jgi:hypothetical protein
MAAPVKRKFAFSANDAANNCNVAAKAISVLLDDFVDARKQHRRTHANEALWVADYPLAEMKSRHWFGLG